MKYFFYTENFYYLAVMTFDVCIAKWFAWPARKVIELFDVKLCSVTSTDKLWKYSILRSFSYIREKAWFGKGKQHPFESMTITIPENYDSILSQDYGDYMTPPPKEQQKSIHYHFFVDFDKRVTEREAYEILNNEQRL